MKIILCSLSILLVACSSSHKKSTTSSWIKESNKLAEQYSLGDATRYPEGASGLGYRDYDHFAVQLENDMETKDLAYLTTWKGILNEHLDKEKDLELRTDYQVLLHKINQGIEAKNLALKYNEIPYCKLSKSIYLSLFSLINPQSQESSKKAAVDRFRRYVKGFETFRPTALACVSRTKSWMARNSGKGFYPFRGEMEEYLEESSSYLKGVQELLSKSGRDDWKEDYELFKMQVEDHDKFILKVFLPKTRKDYKLPEEIYAFRLKTNGVDVTPDELIAMAKKDYALTMIEFKAVAKEVATKHGLKEKTPAAVLKYFKKNPVTNPSEVEALYKKADQYLSARIREHNIVTLPSSPLMIRIASEAESKANPVPRLTMPPLINNKGERPEFVVPTSSSGKLMFDDFAYEAAAIVLTAHEGRPGHDLQFSSMLDQGVSIIRARYAVNYVNIEGWGLYGEHIMIPHMPLDSQFVALQSKLWRTARAFLDPEIQLGRITGKEVIRRYTKEVGMSETMAKLELRRYTFDDPAQAPSYYYGMKKILNIKEKTRKRLGPAFTEKCFNDAVLSFGLLPLNSIGERMEQLRCK